MLYYLANLESLSGYSFLRIFNYISFRMMGGAATALMLSFVLGPIILRALRGQKMHQVVREGTPDSHAGKGTTPTMGGLIFLTSAIISVAFWGRFSQVTPYLWIALFAMIWMGSIGVLDDTLKIKQKRDGVTNSGLVERYKLIGQLTCGLAIGWYIIQSPMVSTLPAATTSLPFFKGQYVVFMTVGGFAITYLFFTTFILVGTTNAVNITDGLDGLCAGLSAIAFSTFGVFAYAIGRYDWSRYIGVFYLPGSGELAVFCFALVGALIGFLWFNAHLAEVFMGDTGSLALGGALGVVAILLKSEFVLAFVGFIFAAETMSVILQRFVFKYRKRRHGLEYAKANRVFLRAPLHHHFEMKGWSEPQVVVRFWILGILSALAAIATLKIR
ncbi:MAG: phospho-N-acetylmuramoyl-pentapeptide-transferase [Gemmatimonadaceae bacterium]